MRRLWGRWGCGHEVGEFAITKLMGRNPIALVVWIGKLAHDERGIVLTIADGGVGRFGVEGVILTPD